MKSGRTDLKPNIYDYLQGDSEMPMLDFDEYLSLKRHKRLKHKALKKLDVNDAFERLIIDNRRAKLLDAMKALNRN
jgi:hypothetical protein